MLNSRLKRSGTNPPGHDVGLIQKRLMGGIEMETATKDLLAGQMIRYVARKGYFGPGATIAKPFSSDMVDWIIDQVIEAVGHVLDGDMTPNQMLEYLPDFLRDGLQTEHQKPYVENLKKRDIKLGLLLFKKIKWGN